MTPCSKVDIFKFTAYFLIPFCSKSTKWNQETGQKFEINHYSTWCYKTKMSYIGFKLTYSKFEAKQSRSKLADFFNGFRESKNGAVIRNSSFKFSNT